MPIKISTTIKRKWMDKILMAYKHTELKEDSEFWHKRLIKITGPSGQRGFSSGECIITFLCGRKSYKYEVDTLSFVNKAIRIDGKLHQTHWQINLLSRVCKKPEGLCDNRIEIISFISGIIHRCTSCLECPAEVDKGGTRCKETTCQECGYKYDTFADPKDPSVKPKVGDICMCMNCGFLGIFEIKEDELVSRPAYESDMERLSFTDKIELNALIMARKKVVKTDLCKQEEPQ